MEILDTNFSLPFRVSSVTKPIVSAEGLFQAECTMVISKTGGCLSALSVARKSRSTGNGERTG